MSTTRLLEPTGDYGVDAGDIQQDGTETSTVLWLLRTQRGSCLVYPNAGNRLARITKLDGAATEREAKQAAEEALAPLVAQKRISDLVVEAQVEGSAMVLTVAFTDVASGAQRRVQSRLGG